MRSATFRANLQFLRNIDWFQDRLSPHGVVARDERKRGSLRSIEHSGTRRNARSETLLPDTVRTSRVGVRPYGRKWSDLL